VEVTAHWDGGYRCHIPVRQFELTADEPETVPGGTDAGPTPTELLLAALASCFAMSLAHVARKRRIELTDLSVTAVGDYDGPRFGALRIEVRSSQDRELLEPLLQRAASLCYVSTTLRSAPPVDCVVLDGSPGG
jgi:putative redox protein